MNGTPSAPLRLLTIFFTFLKDSFVLFRLGVVQVEKFTIVRWVKIESKLQQKALKRWWKQNTLFLEKRLWYLKKKGRHRKGLMTIASFLFWSKRQPYFICKLEGIVCCPTALLIKATAIFFLCILNHNYFYGWQVLQRAYQLYQVHYLFLCFLFSSWGGTDSR